MSLVNEIQLNTCSGPWEYLRDLIEQRHRIAREMFCQGMTKISRKVSARLGRKERCLKEERTVLHEGRGVPLWVSFDEKIGVFARGYVERITSSYSGDNCGTTEHSSLAMMSWKA